VQVGDVLSASDFTTDGTEFHVLAERNFAVFYAKDFTYTGVRVWLDDKKNRAYELKTIKMVLSMWM